MTANDAEAYEAQGFRLSLRSTPVANNASNRTQTPELGRPPTEQPPWVPMPAPGSDMSARAEPLGPAPSEIVSQRQRPTEHTAAAGQAGLSHGEPSATGAPTQFPTASQAAASTQDPATAQLVPKGAIVSSHSPVLPLHVATRHAPEGAHSLRAPVHSPPLQAGVRMHLSATLQLVPFGRLIAAQSPLAMLHAPTLQSVSRAEQSLVCAAVEQSPLAHVPAGVHPLPPHAPMTISSSQLPVVLLQVAAE